MVIKRSVQEKIFETFNAAAMILLSIMTLYPFIHVAFASISDPTELTIHRGIIFHPMGFSIESYRRVFENPMISRGYLNTIFYVVVGTSFNLAMTSLGAYVLSRKGVYWKKFIMFLIVLTMFFDGGLIPFYLLVKGLRMTDTVWAVIIPVAVNTWNLIIMRTSFMAVPDSMEDSARVDGANDFTILLKIIIPLSMPVVAVMLLFYGVGRWNAWFYAMIFLRQRQLYPLQLVLREVLIINSSESMTRNVRAYDKVSVAETIKYATIMVATVPILFIYPFLQKYFVKGVMIGALKE
jgi:putative aldouronate transport system permease protein